MLKRINEQISGKIATYMYDRRNIYKEICGKDYRFLWVTLQVSMCHITGLYVSHDPYYSIYPKCSDTSTLYQSHP